MKIQMNFRLDEGLAEAIRTHAEAEHRTVTQVVELAVMEYLTARKVRMPGIELPDIVKRAQKGGK